MMNDSQHFNKIFWYIVGSGAFVFFYILLITFLPIPKENQRFVDIVLGILLGSILTGGANYLIGGNSNPPKKTEAGGTATADITARITATPEDKLSS